MAFGAEQDEADDRHEQEDGRERDQSDGSGVGGPAFDADDEGEGEGGRQGDADAADDLGHLVAERAELGADVEADDAEDHDLQDGKDEGGGDVHPARGDGLVQQRDKAGVEAEPDGQHHSGEGRQGIHRAGQDGAPGVEVVA